MASVDAWLRLARFALERVKGSGDAIAADHADVALHRVKKALARKPRPRPSTPASSAPIEPLGAFTATRASAYRCTCGYELTGAELEAFLAACGNYTPAHIACKHCGGVAVRMSS